MHIRTKLTILLLAVSVAVIAAAGLFTSATLDSYFHSRLVNELKTQVNEIEYMVRTFSTRDTATYFRLREFAHMANLRLTLIDGEGRVLFESEKSREEIPAIENHLHRAEVQEALRIDYGTTIRRSTTLDLDMLYLAKKVVPPFPDESGYRPTSVMRVGIPLTQVQALMGDIRTTILLASAAVLLLVVAGSVLVSRRLASPILEMHAIAMEIRAGNVDKRLPVRSRDELGMLAEILNSMLDRLNEDIGKLRKLERVRSEFLGNVSHELRTPIFAIQGMLETLLGGALDDPRMGKNFLERSLHNVQRLNSLLGDLIEISRIESGDMKMSFRAFPLRPLLETVASELGTMAAQRNISLTLAAGPDPEIVGDKERIKQAVVNLVDNAIKYTPEGGAVTLSYTREDAHIRVMVTDTGVGIAPEHLPRIFERFYRVDKERSRDAGGTGLGLAIVKHIIEAHGSHVDVTSQVGKGSTFSFTLRA